MAACGGGGAAKPTKSIAAAVADYRKASDKSFQDDKNAVAAAKAGDAAKLRAAITQGNKDNDATFPSAKAIGARAATSRSRRSARCFGVEVVRRQAAAAHGLSLDPTPLASSC